MINGLFDDCRVERNSASVCKLLIDVCFSDLNVSYQIILDLEQGVISDQFRRMFFIIGGQKSFSLSRTCILKKQSEWGCKFEQTVYLSVSCQLVLTLTPVLLLLSTFLSILLISI